MKLSKALKVFLVFFIGVLVVSLIAGYIINKKFQNGIIEFNVSDNFNANLKNQDYGIYLVNHKGLIKTEIDLNKKDTLLIILTIEGQNSMKSYSTLEVANKEFISIGRFNISTAGDYQFILKNQSNSEFDLAIIGESELSNLLTKTTIFYFMQIGSIILIISVLIIGYLRGKLSL